MKKQVLALARATWWLWILFLGAGAGLSYAVEGVLALTVPICIFTFVYFALVRYDEHGNPRDLEE